MSDESRLGPYQVRRQLEDSAHGERWLAIRDHTHTAHVLHCFAGLGEKSEKRRFTAAFERISQLEHPHILPLQEFAFDAFGRAWVVTPYTGNHDGLITLSSLLAAKGGQMAPAEVQRAMVHLLEASGYAWTRGVRHGRLSFDEVLADRHGSLTIELYGLREELSERRRDHEFGRDEIRSIVEIGYTLLTGLPADEPRVRAEAVVTCERALSQWFEAGLDPAAGFASSEEAIAELPLVRRLGEPGRRAAMRSVLGRMRSALRAAEH